MKLHRVFALVPDCHVDGWRYAGVWQRHFYDGLAQAGVAVIRPRGINFGWARPVQAIDPGHSVDARARTSESLLTQILASEGPPPQVVLSCCFSHDIELGLVDQVRAAGIPWINFSCDNLYAFDWVSTLAARTSLNWFVEKEAEPRYRTLGVPFLRAPYALNPSALPDASVVTAKHPLLFIGSVNHHRIRTAALIRLAGANIQIRGAGWKKALDPKPAAAPATLVKRIAWAAARTLLAGRTGDYLDYDTMVEELRRAVVILGLNEGGLGRESWSYLKLRDLELPGMGCCYLAQHNADLQDAFDIGKEIITFRTPWEAARIASDLARHPSVCREIGSRARARVLREHTWAARLPVLASCL